VAKRFVYGTWWFCGFLFLLAVNLFCSAMTRFPWKKYQTGFVLTHLGIICVLAGSLITQQWGVDGQIALNEGEQGHRIQEDKPTLYYQWGGGDIRHIPASFPFRAPSPDRPLLVKLPDDGLLMVDQFYLNAQKEVVGVLPDKGEKGYPAVHLDLASSFVQQNQWLFLGNAEYGHLDLGPASVYFEKEGDWKRRMDHGAVGIPPNALAVLLKKDGSLEYQTRYHGGFQPPQPLRVGRNYSTGWMDMQFHIQDRMPSAAPEQTYLPQPLPSQKDPEPALHYEVLQGPDKKAGWLGYQDQTSFLSKGQTFGIAYGPKQISLPFTLHLIKFHVGFDPGTQKAASYASDVYYEDPEKGVQVPVDISMNKPLQHEGYTVYQASYQTEPDGKYISVFSVGKDPGIWLKYGGAIVLVSGIILMFWFKNPAWGRRENHEV
jgi:ResB-like family